MTETKAEIEAAVLNRVANKWSRGAWSDVLLPKSVPPAIPEIDYANRFGEWLRAQAKEAEE